MSEISCLLCKCSYFNKVETDLDIDVTVYSTAYNSVRSYTSNNEDHISVNVDTSIHNEESSNGEIVHRMYPRDNDTSFSHEYTEIYRYSCEDCGYIMDFSKKKNVENRYQKKKRKQKESEFDWTNFGKKTSK